MLYGVAHCLDNELQTLRSIERLPCFNMAVITVETEGTAGL
jgi:hypothetical protein